MEKSEALYLLIEIEVCNGKLQGAWSGDYYDDEEITYVYEEHILGIAEEVGVEIPPITDYDDEEYPHEYQKLEARATDVFWILEKKFKDIILDL